MREGRIRSASLTSRRSLISPVPSRLGCRHCMLTTSGNGILSSQTSSAVISRPAARTGCGDLRLADERSGPVRLL